MSRKTRRIRALDGGYSFASPSARENPSDGSYKYFAD
jgi:hypothetical protein